MLEPTSLLSLVDQLNFELQDIVKLVRSNLNELDRLTLGALVFPFKLGGYRRAQ